MQKKQLLSKIVEVPHTADAAIEVFGRSLDEVFVNAANGMLLIMEINIQEEDNRCENLSLTENDHESLLVAFLSEILFIVERKRCPSNIQIKISGSQLDSTFHSFPIISSGREIKAVTFNQLKIMCVNGQFQTRIVFDI
jgi:SHS2 domain-containing protein